MRNNKAPFIFLPLIAFLSSCTININVQSPSSQGGDTQSHSSDGEALSSESSEEESGSLDLIQVDPYDAATNHRDLRIDGEGFACEQYTEHTREVEDEGGALKTQHSYVIENVRALVVPIDFTDYTYELYGDTEDQSREELRKIMFGTREETEWYSVSEYYKSSSFGKCNITGDVAPWWHTNVASTSLPKYEEKYNGPANPESARTFATDIRDYYREHADEINLANYDANKDGYVDALIMVCSVPHDKKYYNSSLWWAFTWSLANPNGEYTPTGENEGVYRFFWSTFDMLYPNGSDYYTSEEIKNGTAVADTHRIIHEFGHVLSLPDYYVTDYSSKDYEGLGRLDMMDWWIGDHSAFSKMMLGWINPIRVDGEKGRSTVKLNSTTTTGETIIIPAYGEWNNTLLDQYLMIEFITPEGVAEKDGQEELLEMYPKYYNKAGIRITHVDARIGIWEKEGNRNFIDYTNTTTAPNDEHYVYFAANNTGSESAYSNYKLLEILPATGKSIKTIGTATNDCLYFEGDSFGFDTWTDFKFHSTEGLQDKDFGYKITVDEINGNEFAAITISR